MAIHSRILIYSSFVNPPPGNASIFPTRDYPSGMTENVFLVLLILLANVLFPHCNATSSSEKKKKVKGKEKQRRKYGENKLYHGDPQTRCVVHVLSSGQTTKSNYKYYGT